MEKITVFLILLWVLMELVASLCCKKILHGKLYIVPALVALGTAAYGIYQSEQQKKMAKKLKPSNYVPGSVNEATANARLEAGASISPGYIRGLEKIKQSSSNSINRAKALGLNSSQIQQTVSDADAREKEGIKDIEVNNEQYRIARKQDLNRMLQIKGGYESESNREFNATKSALTGASMQNSYNAVSNAAEGLIYSLPDSAILPDGTKGKKTTVPPTGSGVAMGRYGYGGRGMSQFRNMNLTPLEISILRSKGLM